MLTTYLSLLPFDDTQSQLGSATNVTFARCDAFCTRCSLTPAFVDIICRPDLSRKRRLERDHMLQLIFNWMLSVASSNPTGGALVV